MKMFVMLFMMLMVSVSAFGAVTSDDIAGDFNKLSIGEKAEILTLIASKKESAKNASFSPENISKWVQAGRDVGDAMVGVAEKLGVSADKVLESTSGKIAVGLVVYKIMGKDIVKLITGSCLIVFGTMLWLLCVFKMAIIPTTVMEYIRDDKGEIMVDGDGYMSEEIITGRQFKDGESSFFSWLTIIMIIGAGLLIILV